MTNEPNAVEAIDPVQELRLKIGVMADCLTRMLDGCQGDLLETAEVEYLRVQFDHLGHAYIQAIKIVLNIRQLGEVAELDFARWEPTPESDGPYKERR